MTPLGELRSGDETLTVRPAVEADLVTLVGLIAADAVAAGRGDSTEDLAPYRAALVAIDADPHQLLVCLEGGDGVVVGTLQLTVIPGLAQRGTWRAQIEAVRVADGRRGQGLGAALIGWAVDEARRRGCGLVQLTTHASRHDAHRFYERLGFAHSHRGYKMTLD